TRSGVRQQRGVAGSIAVRRGALHTERNFFSQRLPRGVDQASRIAVTPCPPAAQMEIRPRTGLPVSCFFSCSILASEATIRAPVAANGWPAASDEPLTLSLLRSIEPSGASSPSLPLQYSSDSNAWSVASTTEANASWIS